MQQHKIVERYFFFGLLLVVIILTAFIFRPFLSVIVLGAALSVVLHPVYEWFNAHLTKNRHWLSALITVILFVIVLCGPLYLLGSVVFNQSQNLYQSVTQNAGSDTFLVAVGKNINEHLPTNFTIDVQKSVADLTSFISSHVAQVFTATLTTIFGFLLVLLTLFYLLKDGTYWKRAIVALSPLSDKDDEKIFDKLGHAVNGVIKGYLLIALAQGILSGIGFAIFGIPNAALFGVLAGIASLVPTVGTALILVPAILYLLATGDTGSAIGLLVWGLALVGTVDNLLNPIVVGKNIKLPPILILFSVLGGVALLGPIGILIGPLTLSLLYALISIYRGRTV